MTMLVVYTKNGCKVAADDVRVHTTDQAEIPISAIKAIQNMQCMQSSKLTN